MERYFVGFLYVMVVYGLSLIVLVVAIYKIRKKVNISKSFLLIILAIAVDLILFNLLVYDKVTLKRTDIKFKEHPTSYNFSEKRMLNLISDDVFHNFRSSLYKRPVAISSYTIDADFLDTSTLARLYTMLQDNSSKYPLYDELDRLNIKQFIKYGFLNIDNWPTKEKLFFSYILQAVLEGFMLHKDFYGKYIDIGRITGKSMDDIAQVELFFALQGKELQSKSQLEENILSLLNLSKKAPFNEKKKDYLILAKNEEGKDEVAENQNFYNFLYENISAREYLSYLFEKGIQTEHGFVLLKDYYELINSNKAYKELRKHNKLLNSNMLRVLGVTQPIIKYYESAKLATKHNILSLLNSDKSNKDILYLETKSNQVDNPNSSTPEGLFSYQVLNYNPNVLDLKYQSSGAGYLYFSDCYDNYWSAYIDDKKTDIYKANVAFKAVKIPKGSHKISFIYDPKYFRISLWFYYITFTLCGLYLIIGAFIKVKEN